jgi:hypothetical protein
LRTRRLRFAFGLAFALSFALALVVFGIALKQSISRFPPSVRPLELSRLEWFFSAKDSPDGIIAHLTRGCGGNVDDHDVVEITSSKPLSDHAWYAAKNVADLNQSSRFLSSFRDKAENIPQERNNWICYDFKERRIVPTHYAIRPAVPRLKSWVIEASADGIKWREIDRREITEQFANEKVTKTFPIAGRTKCRFLRLVNIGRNHGGNDALAVEAWEVFGNLFE